MFAKLKKKIEVEGGVVLNSPEGARAGGVNSPRRSESVSSLFSGHLGKESAPSPPASITSEDPSMRDVSSSRDDLTALLQKKSDQCRKLEGNISDLAALIKDKSKTIEKLENSLKQQDEILVKKLQDQKSEFEAYRDKLVEGYQSDKIKLDQEKKELQSKLTAADAYQAKYFRKEEETDEMQGLASQELSKVKHLLLNTEQALTKCRSDLESKTRQYQVAEAQVEKLTDEMGPLKQRLTMADSDNARLKEENTERAELITKLSKEKAAFDKRIDELNQELTVKQSQNNALQVRLADVEETHKTLIRNSDLQRNKSSKTLQEKDDLIDSLNERVATLEQRVADSTLSGDDRATALEAERKQMELKLLETRQQLTEIKSTWSDKITHLEGQIAHLNVKIAEDGEEIKNQHDEFDQMRVSFEKRIEDLKNQLEDAEKRALENFELASSKDSLYENKLMEKESQAQREKLLAKETEAGIQSKAAELKKELTQLKSTTMEAQLETKGKITRLEKREQELESQTMELESKMKEIQICLNQKEEEVRSLVKKVEAKETVVLGHDSTISSLEKQTKELEVSLEKALTDRQDFEKHLRTSQDEKFGLLEKNADLYRQMESLRTSESDCRQEHQRTLTLKAEADTNVKKTEAMLRQKIEALEQQIEQSELSKAESGLYSSRIEEMTTTIGTLENQLTDKTRLVKKQEQMLKDLRQTLQRELKVQSLDHQGDSNTNTASYSSSSPSSNRRATDNPYRPDYSSTSLSSSISSPALSSSLQQSSSSSPSLSSNHPPSYHQHPNSNSGHLANSGSPPSPATLQMDSNYHNLTAMSSSVPSGASTSSLTVHTNNVKRNLEKDVNFQYLKHVVLKFMLSREAEALQLIKAISMLLNFSNHEQQLMRETLEWKMSWFGSRPPQGRGQTSKVIPPTF